MREELLLAKAKYEAANVESSSLVRQMHALQLQLHSVKSGDTDFDSTSIKEKLASLNKCFFEKLVQVVMHWIDHELFQSDVST